MATIFDYLSKSNCQRPVYTSYELGKLVKDKREGENASLEEYAQKYNIGVEILSRIEGLKGTFTPKMYRACASVLEMSLDDILKMENDNIEMASYRAEGSSDAVNRTVEFANQLFNDIIMQKKISIR